MADDGKEVLGSQPLPAAAAASYPSAVAPQPNIERQEASPNTASSSQQTAVPSSTGAELPANTTPQAELPITTTMATEKETLPTDSRPSPGALEAGSGTATPLEKEPPPYSALSKSRRNLILLIVTVAGFFGPLSGGIYLPALPTLAVDFNVSANAINATVSLFLVVFAIGPLFWASISDLNGRRPLYLLSFLIFMAANILLAAVPANYGALVVLRIVQAIGSCSVASLGAGSVADITEPKSRAFAMSIFLLGPQCGPILGPVLGGVFTGQASWRWIFGFLAISSAVLWVFIFFFLPETLRSRVGNGAVYEGKSALLWPPKMVSPPAPEDQRAPAGPKPSPRVFWNLLVYPPIGIVSANTALLFASFYCVSVLQPELLTSRYGWSTTEVGLSYLASGIAMVLGSLTGGKFSDMQRARQAKALVDAGSQDKVQPEGRLWDQIYGVIVCGAGTIMVGWFAQYRIHPAAFLLATFLSGFGMTWVFVTSTSFLTEVAPAQAAGVFALGGLLRNPAGAVAAVVIYPLSERMGLGWCFTGLGLLDLVLVGGSVFLLRIKSPAWRVKRERKMAEAKRQKEEKDRLNAAAK